MSEIFEEYKQICEELNEFEATKIPLCAAETYISDFTKQAQSLTLKENIHLLKQMAITLLLVEYMYIG